MYCTLTERLDQYIAVAFLNACHFVVTDSVQLIIGHRGCLGCELVKTHRLVRILQSSNRNWVGGIIYKHRGVTADFNEVDNVVIYILVITADSCKPAPRLQGGAELFDLLTGPYLFEDTGTE